MKEITVAELKANCSAVIERVRKTKKPVRIMHKGRPIAEIVSPSVTGVGGSKRRQRKNWLGSMAGTAETLGDIVSPVIDLNDIEALRDGSDGGYN